MLNTTLLIVDDNKSVLQSLNLYLKRKIKSIILLENPEEILGQIKEHNVDLVLLDMNFKTGINTGNEGLFWINKILEVDKDIQIIPITAYGHVDLAVKSLRLGAFDFVLKPWENEKLLATLKAAQKLRLTQIENKTLTEKQKHLIQSTSRQPVTMISKSPAMQPVFNAIEKVAKTDANVLILGENGTGKELVARQIHNLSERSNEVFMPVDLGAVTESLFESDLFGHLKGAFTDAREDRAGKFEVAEGGTLFLDEIANLSYPAQAKILTAIQNRTIYRVGSSHPTQIDVRLICATNKDLHALVEQDLFRDDLLFRINTIQIEIPPLRKRMDDIPPLVNHYLKIFADRYNKPEITINHQAIDKLTEYPWPGNVRELMHTIEKVVIMADNQILTSEDFYFSTSKKAMFNFDRPLSLEDGERILIEQSLAKHKGNISECARELRVGRQTLYRKIQKFGLSSDYDS